MTDQGFKLQLSRCELCGEPMPLGEQMFRYHGYSGPCPKPPLSKLHSKAVIEYRLCERRDKGFWIEVNADGREHEAVGPFDTREEAERAYKDLLELSRTMGAVDQPSGAI